MLKATYLLPQIEYVRIKFDNETVAVPRHIIACEQFKDPQYQLHKMFMVNKQIPDLVAVIPMLKWYSDFNDYFYNYEINGECFYSLCSGDSVGDPSQSKMFLVSVKDDPTTMLLKQRWSELMSDLRDIQCAAAARDNRT